MKFRNYSLRYFGPDPDPKPDVKPDLKPEVKPKDDNGDDDPSKSGKTFTQDQLNSFLAKEKRGWQERETQLLDDLKTARDAVETTATTKAELTKQIEKLETANMTATELAQRDLKKAHEAAAAKISDAERKADFWQGHFNNYRVTTDILKSASDNEAFSPEQFIPLLKPMTRLDEVKTDDGHGTGIYKSVVQFPDTNDSGEPIVLELNMDAAFKLMKEKPEKFGNLFKSGAVSGLGEKGGGKLTTVDVSKMSMNEYARRRKDGTLPMDKI